MKDEATPEQLAMARRVINENSNYMQGLDRGQCYFRAQEVMQITLAAIIETTNRIQRLLGNCGEPCPQCWDAIERGDHLKGEQQ